MATRKNKKTSRARAHGTGTRAKKRGTVLPLTKRAATRSVSDRRNKKASAKKAHKKAKKPSFNYERIYYLDSQFGFFEELRSLILKSLPSARQKMTKRITALGKIRLAVISGVFLNLAVPTAADLLVVGEDIDKRKLRKFLRVTESEVGKEVVYAVMNQQEFNYRRRMFDRFIRVLLEGPHEVLLDKVGLE